MMQIDTARYSDWFQHLRGTICNAFEVIERENSSSAKFAFKKWTRDGGGGGEMSVMKGKIFEKVGVNISTVYGSFSEEFQRQIPGAEIDPTFFATGISVVAHMCSPLVPAIHFNTRYIKTTKQWFGGGIDLTPMYYDEIESNNFHRALQQVCDQHDSSYYDTFKKQCDEYFYLKHRNEPRGIGGIFFDYLNTGNIDEDFAFVRDVGSSFASIYQEIVKAKSGIPWTDEQRKFQLIKRGRYVEFNLLYDRGTQFGLMTGGNVDAIFMSMPPEAIWE